MASRNVHQKSGSVSLRASPLPAHSPWLGDLAVTSKELSPALCACPHIGGEEQGGSRVSYGLCQSQKAPSEANQLGHLFQETPFPAFFGSQ